MLVDEEAQARAEVWNHAFGFTRTSVVKCAVELEIPDILEKHGTPVSLSELSSAVDLSPDVLHRIMRFLTYHGIFRKAEPPQSKPYNNDDRVLSVYYAQTPLSRLLTRGNLGPFVQLQGNPTGPSDGLTVEALKAGHSYPGLEYSGSDESLDYPVFGKKYFIDAMASHARFTASAIIDNYPEGFKGIGSLVDVGGSSGVALGMLVKAFPWVQGICFDLPHVVANASPLHRIEFVGGNMFESIPKADAVFLMFILHSWSDEKCIDILKKCKEAVPKDNGKVMIVDVIIDEDGEGDEYTGARLSLDMAMMALTTKGKEKTYKEWAYILKEAGFRSHTVKNIKSIPSLIEAYP